MYTSNGTPTAVIGWVAIGVVVTFIGLAALGATHAHGQRLGRKHAGGKQPQHRAKSGQGRHGGFGGATFGDEVATTPPPGLVPSTSTPGAFIPSSMLNPFMGLAVPQSGDVGPGVNDLSPLGIGTPAGGYL